MLAVVGDGLAQTVTFTRPSISGNELKYLRKCLKDGHIAGDGEFTRRCHGVLERLYGSAVMLTHSCTAALEMAAMLVDAPPGSEVIMPSFTFVSTANAFVLRGVRPVFVDIRPDTLNIDERLIEAAITPRTRAIVAVHYAGVGCDMAAIGAIAARHRLIVLEDAAQGHLATWSGRPLGTFGALGCLSFHESKNVVAGEGGALIVNDPALLERAYILREKGTNRTSFLRREVRRYEWLDIGSSYLPSDLIAAVLLGQLERAEAITTRRLAAWRRFHAAFADLETAGLLRRPNPPPEAGHNGHIYFLVMPSPDQAQHMLTALAKHGIHATSHYVPLHSSPAGRRFGRSHGALPNTEHLAASLVRLPLFADMTENEQNHVIAVVRQIVGSYSKRRTRPRGSSRSLGKPASPSTG